MQFRPVVRWHEDGGIHERFFNGEVFFECNLSRNDRHHRKLAEKAKSVQYSPTGSTAR
jgi:hypothetical protein